MDSCNSDSSSCGEEQEYDSRASAAAYSSSFVNHHPVPPPPPPPPFDPFSNFLQLQNPSPLNPNLFWPRSADPSSDLCNPNNIINFPYTAPPQPPPTADGPSGTLTAAENVAQSRAPTAGRNTKKRSRASRRAPTTVLTTDMSNFRAMVQEFTGIPAPPFASSSPFQRSRLDLYGASSSMRLKPHHSAAPLPYLHRPFAPEVLNRTPQPPFLTSTTSIPSSSATNSAFSSQSSNLFNFISNSNLASFLPTDHKFPFASSNINLPSKVHPGSFEINPVNQGLHSNHVKTVGFDEFSLSRNLPNLVSASDQVRPRNHHNNDDDNSFSRQEKMGTRNSEGMMEYNNGFVLPS